MEAFTRFITTVLAAVLIFTFLGPAVGLQVDSLLSENPGPIILFPPAVFIAIWVGFHPALWAGLTFGLVVNTLPAKYFRRITHLPTAVSATLFSITGALAGAAGCAIVAQRWYTFGVYMWTKNWAPYGDRFWQDAQYGIPAGAVCGAVFLYMAKRAHRNPRKSEKPI